MRTPESPWASARTAFTHRPDTHWPTGGCRPAAARRLAVALAALAAHAAATLAAAQAPGAAAAGAPPSAPVCADTVAADLAAAVHAVSATTYLRETDVLTRSADLAAALGGVSANLGLRPSVGLGDGVDFADEVDPLDLIGFQVDAAVGYRYDELAALRAEASLHTARTRLAAQRRADVVEALVSSSRLRVAQRAEAAAEAELALLLTSLATAEATAAARAADPDYAPPPGADLPGAEPELGPLYLREARLRVRQARLALEDARVAVAALRDSLAELGVHAAGGQAEAALGCRLAALPEPGPADGDAHASARTGLALALRVAEAQLVRARFAPLRDLSLEAYYQEGGNRLTGTAGLDLGRPELGLALRWRPTGKDAWSVRLSADIRLDESMGAAVRQAEAGVAAAQAELDAFDAGRAARLNASRNALERAWLEVELLDEAVQLALLRRDDPGEARNLPRNEQAVLRALDARERGLQAYYRAYAAHLTTLGAAWRAR